MALPQVPVVANAVLAGILAALPPVNLAFPVGPGHVSRSANRLSILTHSAHLATDIEVGEHHMFHALVIELAQGPGAKAYIACVLAFVVVCTMPII